MRSLGNAWNRKIWPVSLSQIEPKFEKWKDRDHKINSYEGGQDTSACNISGHSLHAFSDKCPDTTNLTRFNKSK